LIGTGIRARSKVTKNSKKGFVIHVDDDDAKQMGQYVYHLAGITTGPWKAPDGRQPFHFDEFYP
jgi:hypothetical protein